MAHRPSSEVRHAPEPRAGHAARRRAVVAVHDRAEVPLPDRVGDHDRPAEVLHGMDAVHGRRAAGRLEAAVGRDRPQMAAAFRLGAVVRDRRDVAPWAELGARLLRVHESGNHPTGCQGRWLSGDRLLVLPR